MRAARFATTSIRPEQGRGAFVRAGWLMSLTSKLDSMTSGNCIRRASNSHLPLVPASLELGGYEVQMQPGEGSA